MIKNVADTIHANGYMPIPLVPGERAIKIDKWTELARNGEYDTLWKGAPENSNIGIFTGQNVIIADFDAKGDAPSIKVYDYLLEHEPRTFAGAILERTQSGGIHATFKWCNFAISVPANSKGKTYMRFEIDGTVYDAELLTRGSQAVCPPSKGEKGEYVYLSEQTHINTRRDDLPVLPEILRDANNRYIDETMLAQQRAENLSKANKDYQRRLKTAPMLRAGELDTVIDECVRIYAHKAREGNRHPQAIGLSRNVAGLPGAGRGDVERAVNHFYNTVGGEPPTASEVAGIIRHGWDNPDSDPLLPLGEVMIRRKKSVITDAMKRRAMV